MVVEHFVCVKTSLCCSISTINVVDEMLGVHVAKIRRTTLATKTTLPTMCVAVESVLIADIVARLVVARLVITQLVVARLVAVVRNVVARLVVVRRRHEIKRAAKLRQKHTQLSSRAHPFASGGWQLRHTLWRGAHACQSL